MPPQESRRTPNRDSEVDPGETIPTDSRTGLVPMVAFKRTERAPRNVPIPSGVRDPGRTIPGFKSEGGGSFRPIRKAQ